MRRAALPAASYYEARAAAVPAYPALTGQCEAEVAIVGGGYAGLNTALGLAERGQKGVVLLEAERIGFGASGRNGGFVFAGYSLGEQALLRQLGEDRARALYQATMQGVNLVRRRVQRYGIGCDLADAGVLWTNWFRDARVLEQRRALLARLGAEWQPVDTDTLREWVCSSRYHGALYEPNAMHLDPLAYARGLAHAATQQGVEVRETSRVLKLGRRPGGGFRLHTGGGRLDARQVLLACGGYLSGLASRVDRAVLPIATYVMVTEPLGTRLYECLTTAAAVYDTRFAFDYYRPLPDTRLLWGGRIDVRQRDAESIRRLLYQDMLRVFPQLRGVRVDYGWSGLMSYARHQMPQIGGDGKGMWWAQAFGGHGLAPTAVTGELLAAAIGQGDGAWREFSRYGLDSALRPWGLLAAQARYAWLQWHDARKERRERRARD